MGPRKASGERTTAQLQVELDAARRLVADLVEQSPHAVVVHSDGLIRYANRAAAALVGLKPEGLVGTRLLDHVAPSSRAAVIERFHRVLKQGAPVSVNETHLLRSDGSVVVTETAGGRTEWEGRPAVHVVLWDVSRRREVEEQLSWDATHDALTGLGNRRYLDEALSALLSEGVPVGLLYVDLDGFKAVNDAYGHDVGDELLVRVAQRLAEAVQAGDTVARVGGDEFIVGLRGVGEEARAKRIGERVLAVLAEPFDIRGARLSVGASFGVATASGPSLREDAVHRADQDLLAAKRRREFRALP